MNIKNLFQLISKNIGKIVLYVWVILSVVYIGYNFWQKMVNNYYLAGKVDTINSLIKEAEKPECQPFSVYTNDKQIQLINVACLKQPQSGN